MLLAWSVSREERPTARLGRQEGTRSPEAFGVMLKIVFYFWSNRRPLNDSKGGGEVLAPSDLCFRQIILAACCTRSAGCRARGDAVGEVVPSVGDRWMGTDSGGRTEASW